MDVCCYAMDVCCYAMDVCCFTMDNCQMCRVSYQIEDILKVYQ
jgi:hypothetical protein